MRLRRCYCCGRWAPRRLEATLAAWAGILWAVIIAGLLHGCWTGPDVARHPPSAERRISHIRYVPVTCFFYEPPKLYEGKHCDPEDADCLWDLQWETDWHYRQLQDWADWAYARCSEQYRYTEHDER